MKKIKLNNGENVVNRFKSEEVSSEFMIIGKKGVDFIEPHITDKNIKNNSKFIVDLFDSMADEEPKTLKKLNNVNR